MFLGMAGVTNQKGLSERPTGRPRHNHGGEDARENSEAWAVPVLAPEPTARRWKGEPQKLNIARRLRQKTTMTLQWIAERLNMGAAGSLANLPRHNWRKR